MNEHNDIRRDLSAYSNGDLDPSLAARVERHLTSCADCRAELAELKTTLHLLRSTPEVEPPPWLTARVMSNVKAQQTERRSWLRRIFFPLHLKLPLEAMALLMVCVTGWYISRSVETELRQPAVQQSREIPVHTTPEASKDLNEKTAPPLQPAQPPALQPMAPKTVQRPVAEPVRDIPASVPSYTPPPPSQKDKFSAPAAGDRVEPAKTAPAAESFQRNRNALSEKKQESASDSFQTRSGAPVPAGRSAGKAAARPLPQVFVRLDMTDSAAAPKAVREALLSSGATIRDESELPRRRIKARIPATRATELLERLEQLGRIGDRPVLPSDSPELEFTVQW